MKATNTNATAWEMKILSALDKEDDTTTFIVTTNSQRMLRLWWIWKNEFTYNKRFLNYDEFKDFVMCDCPATPPGTVIPEHAERVFIHAIGVHWDYLPEPTHTVITQEK